MKKLQSLQALALAGVAITFMATGCSSTSSNRADYGSTDDSAELAAYRMSSALGSVPITQSRMLNKFPLEWGPVSYESYTFRVPVADQSDASVASARTSRSTTIATTSRPATTITTSSGAPGEATVTTSTEAPRETTVTTTTANPSDTSVTTISSAPAEHTLVTTETDTRSFSSGLQPGDTFVEAAGADGTPVVKRVIRYTPFGGGGGTSGGSQR
jgi:hypothetical protein